MATKYLSEAKKLIASNDKKEVEEGFLALYRSHKCLPKNKALIKFLSEQGIKAGMLKTEEIYMEQNNKRMHEVTEPLYFVIDEKLNSVDLTDKGIDLITGNSEDPTLFVLPDIAAELSELENMNLTNEQLLEKKDELLTNYAIKSERVHTINQLLKAYTMFEKDDEYVVIDGQVKIVDEQTGRIMEGRRYSDGLHQAIEAKEGVKVEAATQTFATITLQNYFRMYHKLSGMTGTAETEAGELWDIYKLDVVVIPTNRPIARKDMNDRVYKTKREKYKAVIEEIEQLVNARTPGIGRYYFGRNLRNAEQDVDHAQNRAQRIECETASERSRHRGQSRFELRRNHRHQHGGSWYGHQAEPGSKSRGRSCHYRYGASRVTSCRPPAAWSCRTSGRPRFIRILRVFGRRPDASVLFRPYCRRNGQTRFQGRRND